MNIFEPDVSKSNVLSSQQVNIWFSSLGLLRRSHSTRYYCRPLLIAPVAPAAFVSVRNEFFSRLLKNAFRRSSVPRRLKPLLISRHLRRGSKPRPFKTEPRGEFFSGLLEFNDPCLEDELQGELCRTRAANRVQWALPVEDCATLIDVC